MQNPSASLRVLVVSQYYPPEAHGTIAHSVAHGLSERGHDVRVVTTFPNHPVGRVFRGWRQRLRQVDRDGAVTVHRTPMLTDHSGRALRRVLSYCSFALSSLSATRAARSSDVVYVYCAQPTAALAPMLWRRLFGVPYVLHVQDIWPESVLGSGMVAPGRASRLVTRVILAWLRRVHGGAAHIVTISDGAAALLVDRGAAADRVSTVLNWAPTTEPAQETRTDPSTTNIVYAGTLGPNQGFDTVLAAAARCRDLDGLGFEVVGGGLDADRLRELAERLGADNVRFRGAVAEHSMPAVHARADFEIVALADAPMSAVTIPSKLQAALAHGVPVIGAVPGDAAAIVRDGDAGFVAEPGDVDGLEAAFRAAHATDGTERRRLAANARAVVADRMRPDRALDHLESILRKAAR